MYRTRIAPSPTGLFHLGTARTAYFSWLAARASHGQFILRIDDTDIERNREEYIKVIFDSLEWLGLEPDQVYFQSKRTNLYQSEARDLLYKGKAIDLLNGAIAIKVPYSMPGEWRDSISGIIPITDTNRNQIDRRVILLRGKDKGNLPTYQFASILDDYFMRINWIIRGHDHISNTPKQIAIWCALNEIYSAVNSARDLPKFSHVGLVHKDGKKLSKRDQAASLLWYRDNGYSSGAILDFILRLGWSTGLPDTPKLISKSQAIDLFLKGNLRAAPSSFDQMKLEYLRRKYDGSSAGTSSSI